jgi:hypothetical protein
MKLNKGIFEALCLITTIKVEKKFEIQSIYYLTDLNLIKFINLTHLKYNSYHKMKKLRK